MRPRPRALICAYACEPGRGSEPGAGWGLVRAIAEFADCVVLAGPAHESALRRWSSVHPDAPIQFVAVPESSWPAPAGRGRIKWFLAYLRWIPNARRTASVLHSKQPFDLTWHATYSAYWLPSPLSELRIPSIWGPVGGAVTTPRSLWPTLGWKGMLTEMTDRIVVRVLAALPSARGAAMNASVRIAQNEETRQRMPKALREGTRVLNHALFVELEPRTSVTRGREIAFAASLESRKGAELAVRAMSHTSRDVKLAILGDGPERANLEALATRLGVSSQVTFCGVVSRSEVQSVFARSAAAVFTGVREEGGLALAEAMYSGTPVIVLAIGGAAAIARCGTDSSRIKLIPIGNSAETVRALGVAMTAAVLSPSPGSEPTLDRSYSANALRDACNDVLGLSRSSVSMTTAMTAQAYAESVTVVIPVFNGARYLESAVRSALAQTHRNVSVVIVDDGSTDDTLLVANRVALTDSRVRVLHVANGGRARARNLGVASAAASDLVAFLDADDLWEDSKLREQIAVLRSGPAIVGVGSFMRYISSSGTVLGETGQAIDAEDLRRIARGDLAPFPISSCLVVRLDIFQRLGGFDEELREAEDLDFIARLAREGEIKTVERSLGSYRLHPDSAMATARRRINMYARFVRKRIAERDAGRDLHWGSFERSYQPSLRERRRDAIETWYRAAALWSGEGRRLRGLRFGIQAALVAPIYTIRRLHRQRGANVVAR